MGVAKFIQKGGTLDFTNSTAAVIAYGDVIPATTRILVAGENIAVGAIGSAQAKGVFELPADNTVAFAVGDQLYWDNTNKKLNKTASGNTPAGFSAEVKALTGTTGRVCIG